MTGKTKKVDEQTLKNRMEDFQRLSEDHRLGHFLWGRMDETDKAFGKEKMGLAMHNVVSLIINAYRIPRLRKRIEKIIEEV